MAGLVWVAMSFNDAIRADGAIVGVHEERGIGAGISNLVLVHEDDRDGILVQIAVPGVSDKADDPVDQVGLSARLSLVEGFADGVRAGEKAARELLVDDRFKRRSGSIVFAEISAGDHGDLQRLKISCARCIEVHQLA